MLVAEVCKAIFVGNWYNDEVGNLQDIRSVRVRMMIIRHNNNNNNNNIEKVEICDPRHKGGGISVLKTVDNNDSHKQW